MNRGTAAIRSAFADGKAFIPFITCGDPDLETTKEIVRAMAEAGASLIELGIPFSDPTAEGPTIQEANLRALSGGVTTDKIFAMVRQLRQGEGEQVPPVEVPMVFMTYANVVYSYGTERFLDQCVACGIDGLILPDVPFEEKEDFAPALRARDMALISLVAPTSEDRISRIAQEADGFLYVVSSLGVTGVRSAITTDIGAIVRKAKEAAAACGREDLPCAVGFGISTPEQAAKMAAQADGVIVGSAIVKLIAEYGKAAPAYVALYVRRMKEAMLTGRY